MAADNPTYAEPPRHAYFTVDGRRSANAVQASEWGIEPSPDPQEMPGWWAEVIGRFLFTLQPCGVVEPSGGKTRLLATGHLVTCGRQRGHAGPHSVVGIEWD